MNQKDAPMETGDIVRPHVSFVLLMQGSNTTFTAHRDNNPMTFPIDTEFVVLESAGSSLADNILIRPRAEISGPGVVTRRILLDKI
jgi:hypothetical protein